MDQVFILSLILGIPKRVAVARRSREDRLSLEKCSG